MKAFFITNVEKPMAKAEGERNVALCLKFGNFQAEIFEAVRGDEALSFLYRKKIEFVRNRYVTPEFIHRNNDERYNFRAGVAGCFGSHFKLWEKCIKLNEPIGIFEYDAVQVRELPEVKWEDFLYLSAWRNWKGNANEYYEDLTPPGVHDYVGYDRWGLPNCVSGTHAYLITPKAAQIAVNSAYERGWAPADRFFSTNICPFRKQTINPAVFKVGNSYNLSAKYHK